MDSVHITEAGTKESTSTTLIDDVLSGVNGALEFVQDNPVETAVGVGLTTLAVIGTRGRIWNSIGKSGGESVKAVKPWNNPASMKGSPAYMESRVAHPSSNMTVNPPWRNPASTRGGSGYMESQVAREIGHSATQSPIKLGDFAADLRKINPVNMKASDLPTSRSLSDGRNISDFIKSLMGKRSPLTRYDQSGFRPIPARVQDTSPLTRYDQSRFPYIPVRMSH